MTEQMQVVRAFDMMKLFLRETHACVQGTRIACSPLAQTPEDKRFHALFMRVVTWIRSEIKLDEPSDFQTVLGVTRSLFETVVDLVLLFHGDAEANVRMQAWERSARFKHANLLCEYYRALDGPLPPEFKAHGIFMSANRATVEKDRKTFWGGKHPRRWTGNSLENDTKEAERFGGPLGLVAFHETHYRNLCFYLHGSSVAGAVDGHEDLRDSGEVHR